MLQGAVLVENMLKTRSSIALSLCSKIASDLAYCNKCDHLFVSLVC